MIAQQIQLSEFRRTDHRLIGHRTGGHRRGGTVEGEFQIRLDQFFQRAGELALFGLDELQVSQPLAGLGFLMLQRFHR